MGHTSESPEPAHRVRAYHRWQLGISLLGLAVGIGYLGVLLATGVAGALGDALMRATPHWWLTVPALVLILAGAYRLITLPLLWVSGFWLPRRFGLSHQPVRDWVADVLKAVLVGSAIMVAAVEIIYALLRTTPWWWLWSAAALWIGAALLALVAPVWLMPLFYRLTPLVDAGLRERLVALARRTGAPVLGVWVADHSRKGRAANAAVTGLGRTRRVILFDTLVRDFPPDEVEAVLAHELAHHLHRDIWRGLGVQAAVFGAAFGAAALILRVGGPALGLTGPADHAGVPLLGLALLGVSLLAVPAVNAWSRRCERRADEFALRTASRPRAFVEAMERLASLNLAERDPHPVKEFLLYSHPSVGRRIARAKALLGAQV